MASGLLTDKYCLTMGQFYFDEDMHEDAVSFELFIRRLPATRGYLVVAGLGTALWHLNRWGFSGTALDYLASQQQTYTAPYLEYLRWLDFTCDVHAIPEGTIVGPHTPLLRVTGPRIQGTLIESLLLSIINHQTMIASKAARIVSAASPREVWDFSLRRLHGPEASLGVARAAYIAGCAGTATEEAGRILHIPTTGTMAHAQVMAYGPDREREVFCKVLDEFPTSHALLVDTYDTRQGVLHAIQASGDTDIPLRAIRVDSNLEEDARLARDLLESAARTSPNIPWFRDTRILASNDLDEYEIGRLTNAGVPIDAFGVGTMLGTSADAPNLSGVYKLVEQHNEYKKNLRYPMKLTPGKLTDPGDHQVWRKEDWSGDVLALTEETPRRGRPLLELVMNQGRIVKPRPPLDQSREWCEYNKHRMPAEVLRLEAPEPWTLSRSQQLLNLRRDLGDPETLRFAAEEIET